VYSFQLLDSSSDWQGPLLTAKKCCKLIEFVSHVYSGSRMYSAFEERALGHSCGFDAIKTCELLSEASIPR